MDFADIKGLVEDIEEGSLDDMRDAFVEVKDELVKEYEERRNKILSSNTCKLLKENIEAESRAGSEYDVLAKNARKHKLEGLAITAELIRDNEKAHNNALRRYYDKHCK